eukprot:3410787-Rhodomonas_salina.1
MVPGAMCDQGILAAMSESLIQSRDRECRSEPELSNLLLSTRFAMARADIKHVRPREPAVCR